MPRFTDALDRTASEVKRAPAMPVGFYKFRVAKVPEIRENKDRTFEIMNVPVQVLEAIDVDADDLAAFGPVNGKPNRVSFLFPTTEDRENDYENALDQFKTFCERCGIDVEDGTVKMWMANLPNSQFIAEVTHRADENDQSIVYAEINRSRITKVE